eukprot:353299-Chlamydomonas_euryale.AAC.8
MALGCRSTIFMVPISRSTCVLCTPSSSSVCGHHEVGSSLCAFFGDSPPGCHANRTVSGRPVATGNRS